MTPLPCWVTLGLGADCRSHSKPNQPAWRAPFPGNGRSLDSEHIEQRPFPAFSGNPVGDGRVVVAVVVVVVVSQRQGRHTQPSW